MRGSGISWTICKSAPRSRQITTPAPHRSVFYRPDALPAAQPTVSKHWRRWLLQQWQVNAGSAMLSAYLGSWTQTCVSKQRLPWKQRYYEHLHYHIVYIMLSSDGVRSSLLASCDFQMLSRKLFCRDKYFFIAANFCDVIQSADLHTYIIAVVAFIMCGCGMI